MTGLKRSLPPQPPKNSDSGIIPKPRNEQVLMGEEEEEEKKRGHQITAMDVGETFHGFIHRCENSSINDR